MPASARVTLFPCTAANTSLKHIATHSLSSSFLQSFLATRTFSVAARNTRRDNCMSIQCCCQQAQNDSNTGYMVDAMNADRTLPGWCLLVLLQTVRPTACSHEHEWSHVLCAWCLRHPLGLAGQAPAQDTREVSALTITSVIPSGVDKLTSTCSQDRVQTVSIACNTSLGVPKAAEMAENFARVAVDSSRSRAYSTAIKLLQAQVKTD